MPRCFAPEGLPGCVMSDSAFPYLPHEVLSVFERLETPMAVFGLDTRSIIWANESAHAYFAAHSFDHEPGLEIAAHPAIAAMLDVALHSLKQEQRWQQLCPLNPTGARVNCTGIRLDGHPEALLLEVWRPAKPIVAVDFLTLPDVPDVDEVDAARETRPAAISEKMLHDLLDFVEIAAVVMSANGAELLKTNSAALQLLQTATTISAPAPALFANAHARAVFLDELARHGRCKGAAQMVAKDGRNFAAAISGSRLQVGEKEVILLMVQDIDELHRVSVEIETALGLQRNVTHQQRKMLEIASHEFRTPLAVIDGAAQRIARQAANGNTKQIAALATRVRDTVASLGSILENTVERARNNRAGIECRPAPGLLQSVIAQVALMFEEKADVEIAESINKLAEVSFDRVLLEHVFVNLIENAVKYSTGHPRVRLSAVVERDKLGILVRDWGIGILPEDHERVFAESVRGKNVGLRVGSGLGLYIVKSILQAHGGDISVVATPGPGTTFKVILPVR